ncbi:hypothetical protein BJ322DRAFT_549 [Thelephora terrestris]|uniref:Uncharacterized protein n=1 Tax=Thelephora terrestris TaxID=56493 RepID=A0A9P6HNY3_9AGAM|nr:hypothetical protein BJ322DRAFT_549 [Thelephora terrestris]
MRPNLKNRRIVCLSVPCSRVVRYSRNNSILQRTKRPANNSYGSEGWCLDRGKSRPHCSATGGVTFPYCSPGTNPEGGGVIRTRFRWPRLVSWAFAYTSTGRSRLSKVYVVTFEPELVLLSVVRRTISKPLPSGLPYFCHGHTCSDTGCSWIVHWPTLNASMSHPAVYKLTILAVELSRNFTSIASHVLYTTSSTLSKLANGRLLYPHQCLLHRLHLWT